jgi:hypothetical protein
MLADARGDRKTIRSKVAQFPDDILDLLDAEISLGRGSSACMKVLKLNYRGTLLLPSRDTMENYVRSRRAQLRGAVDRRLELESRLSSLPEVPDLRLVTSGRDMHRVMDTVLDLQAERVEIIRELQGSLLDSRYEQILVDTLAKITATVEKKLKLEQSDGLQKTRLQAIVGVLLRHISGAVSSAYKDVHSDNKLDQFVKALDKRLDSLPLETIEAEVANAVTSRDGGKVLNLPEHR